jgi:sporulation protein YlmC with PRC-barrel domain
LLHQGKDLRKQDIRAVDGEIGTVHDFLFDDKHWTTRYLVVDTMKWLPGRKVLISPMSIEQVKSTEDVIKLTVSKETIKNTPEIDTDKPVSREKELEFYGHYSYLPYWSSGVGVWGPYWYPADLAKHPDDEKVEHEGNERDDGSKLRSMKEVTGYDIVARDGSIGHVEDFLFDDESWTVRYIIVDTKNWWPGKKVLVAPDSITQVNWNEETVHIDLPKDTIKNSLEYNPNDMEARGFKDILYTTY